MPQDADRNPAAQGLFNPVAAASLSSSQRGTVPAFDCQSCGACCSYSAEWPRFSTEDDAHLDRIPDKYVATDLSGMRCEGPRCSALCGEVGKATACGIYELRPDVCRACMPGDEDCLMARRAHGLPVL
ncbi:MULTISPECIES: YkgJ family cysteine cluster protein [unclassified Mesorhizobium]|uniref:YkgJ family cysteine cluster protein n=1 Tax=unclassified Mesorhizobium TaxID=325217 RepID=UPI00112E53B4|nr:MULTISPECIES: YkgJ family cysteine cluster protein [unclassified Mesorhizobium]TPJ47063.1 YkgJ family cysteine cluster protein [Mesorhizobium sp. B2-6-6]MBZ9921164.1 YkgJ family cysteine cluster protein [Mesorhizobium sp. BR1-1-7]MBZ9955210.1 YkgJ family cysteine cluster protein [Mesorhizobium sp. BR1-1-15]MBZ9971096.1 YkgJ family cysteine cluster protein [Mesorhizobium sp. BR1-1-12]MBZ9998956.1 YkgJ family cysteine cluster protein [Mesorhizobium sp. B264B2A]